MNIKKIKERNKIKGTANKPIYVDGKRRQTQTNRYRLTDGRYTQTFFIGFKH